MSLSSLIVQREVATIRQVEEALARQVIYGGDLITNLLEVASLEEPTVAHLLAESLGLEPAPTGELPLPSERARALVPAEMAAHRAMVPVAVEHGRLVIAVAEKLSREVVEQLSFALGLPIEQRAAPMVRIRQAIANIYSLPLERRMQRLVARLGGFQESTVSGSTPPVLSRHPSVQEPPRPPSAPPVRHTPAFGVPAAKLSAPPMPTRTITASGFPAEPTPTPSIVSVMPVSVPAPTPMSAPAPAPASASEPPLSEPPDTPTVPAPPRESNRPATLVQRDVVTARPSRRRRGPLTIDSAKKEIDAAADRDALLDLFFDFARQFFDYTVLFIVHGDIAEGRDAFGVGASRDRVIGIGVPLDLPSLLATARERKRPVTAKPSADGLDSVLLADLQRATRGILLIVPVVVRKRVVALLLGDSGDGGVDPAGVGEVVQFAASAGHAFERLIVRRKLEGFIADQGPAKKARVDPAIVAVKRPPTPEEFGAPSLGKTDPSLPAVVMPHDAPEPQPREPEPASAPTVVAAGVSESGESHSVEHRRVITRDLMAVRRPAGPPIPREEPGQQVDPRREPEEVEVDDASARELIDSFATETTPPDLAAQQIAIAVGPHLPPSSRQNRGGESGLPSVIVDVAEEHGDLVERYLTEPGNEGSEAELLRLGTRVMPAIMARFPGPIAMSYDRADDAMPRASDCGPILRLVARQRKVALPFVLAKILDDDPERRFWATLLVTELPYPEAIGPLTVRIFDDEPRTVRAARAALRSLARIAPQAVVDELAQLAMSEDEIRRAAVLDTFGELREPLSVPLLIHLLGNQETGPSLPARRALTLVTRQDFGEDARAWDTWWTANAGRHRVEWLIDALGHPVAALRAAASEELKSLTQEYFGYSDNLPPRERERAQQRYRDWWVTEGRAKFRKR